MQIHLQQNRTDLALKEVQAARRWAQDSLLINIAESWVGIRVGGEKYQQAFYVFEEMAQAPASTAPLSLVSQAVAEIHLGRYEEAEEALKQAVDKDPEDADAIANQVVVSVLSGQDPTSLIAYVPAIPPSHLLLLRPLLPRSSLKEANPEHAFLKGVEEKSSLFDQAAAKFSAKVAG